VAISHSSAERIILPDAAILTHFMLVEITDLVKHLQVYPENMQRNMNLYGGVIFSQSVLLALVNKGMNREAAYAIVQTHAHQAWNQEGGNFRQTLCQDPQVQQLLSAVEIDQCFDPSRHLQNLDQVYQRLDI
jgi:adenylosuccinate lyase